MTDKQLTDKARNIHRLQYWAKSEEEYSELQKELDEVEAEMINRLILKND